MLARGRSLLFPGEVDDEREDVCGCFEGDCLIVVEAWALNEREYQERREKESL